MEPLVVTHAELYPSIGPNIRCVLALAYADESREAEARAEFERLAAAAFVDLPSNLAWLFALACLAEACAFLRDARRAGTLYGLLLPFAARNVTVGPVLAVGAVARYLGLLAATQERWADAVTHFEAAVEMNGRMGMRPALARTLVDYAETLLARHGAGDGARALELANGGLAIAQELGMKRLVEKALTAKLRAQGIAPRAVAVSIDAVVSLVERERPDLRAHAAPDGTVTILFTDIEGSTAMTERLGDARARELIRAHNTIVRRQIAAHGGFEVKSQGDGFMIAFQSARRALRCATETQRAFAAYNAGHPEEPIRVRIGLHTGEAIREADDFFGKAVIEAARIAAGAAGGEILVSALSRELTEGAGEFAFGPLRQVELRGLTGPRQVSPVAW
jgi:class 3 adenylate cyclase